MPTVEPIPKRWMGHYRHWMGKDPTEQVDICTVLKAIYHCTGNERVRDGCRVAIAMAQKMRNRLTKYKEGK
jgi:hypothetical protein